MLEKQRIICIEYESWNIWVSMIPPKILCFWKNDLLEKYKGTHNIILSI